MSSPNGLYEWLALAGAVAGAIAVVLLLWVAVSLHRVRRGQKVVMGAGERDIVRHAASLQQEFIALRDWLDEASGQLDARMKIVEDRLDGAVAHTAMLRYDAFGAMSGRQSSSVALLDENKSGVVLSAIVHRSHSHLYVKQIREGASDIELSPEEQQVVNMAFEGHAPESVPEVAPQPQRVVSQPTAQSERTPQPPAAGAAGR